MGYREAKELALLRQTLRDRLEALDAVGAAEALSRLRDIADDTELAGEYQRWAFRFGLLAA